jgi:DNA-binding LytR/AlgR family response regulator
VLKPVTPERVAKLVDRLKQRLASPPADLSEILQHLAARASTGSLRWIKASLGATMRLIPVDEICYFRAEDKYTRVVTADGDALIRKTIKELFEELDPESFWQVHRGTIVNLREIARVERDHRDQPLIVLKHRKESLMVSRTFAHLFKAM